MSIVRAVLTVVGLSLLWPAVHLIVFVVRFGRLPVDVVVDSAVFLPMGVVAAVIFVLVYTSVATSRQRRAVVVGYVVASPFAFIGSLVSGLVSTAVAGSLALGTGSLFVGMLTAAWLARPTAGSQTHDEDAS